MKLSAYFAKYSRLPFDSEGAERRRRWWMTGALLAALGLTTGHAKEPPNLDGASTAQAKAKPADGPARGAWTLVNGDGQQEFRSTLVIVRQQGPYVEGYWDSQLDGGPVCVQIVAGTFDSATARLQLDGREILTRYDEAVLGPGTQRFECVLSADRKEIRDFVSVGNPTHGVARWKIAGQPNQKLAELTAAIDDTEPVNRLYQQFSADYIIGGLRVLHGPDRYMLKRLTESTDKQISELATVRLALLGMHDDVQQRAEKFAGDLRRELPLPVYWFAARTIDDAVNDKFSWDPLLDLLKTDIVKRKFRQNALKTAYYIHQTIILDGFRSMVQTQFGARRAARLKQVKPALASFRVNRDKCGVISIANTTGAILHHCIVFSHIVVDQQRMDGYERDFWKKELGTTALLAIAGADNLVPTVEGDKAMLAYNRLDKGMPAYLPVWKPGAVLELEVARADAIAIVGESIDIWVGCDEGTLSVDLDMEGARKIVAAEAAPMKAPIKNGRTHNSRP